MWCLLVAGATSEYLLEMKILMTLEMWSKNVCLNTSTRWFCGMLVWRPLTWGQCSVAVPLPTWCFGIRPQWWRLGPLLLLPLKDSLLSISLRRDHSLVSQSPDPQAFLRLSPERKDLRWWGFPIMGQRVSRAEAYAKSTGSEFNLEPNTLRIKEHYLSCHHNDPLPSNRITSVLRPINSFQSLSGKVFFSYFQGYQNGIFFPSILYG